MKLVPGLCVSLVAAGLPLAAAAPQDVAQQDIPTFRSTVARVPISAVVRDHRGRLVTNLRASDFEVVDNNEPRQIIDFSIDATSPIALALLVDTSGSMRMAPKMTFARQVVDAIVGELGDGRDEAAIFTFDATLQERRAFTTGSAVGPVLDDVAPFGTTSLHDAVAEAARRVAARPQRHRAVVVVTDGLDTSSMLKPSEVSAIASAIDVPVYVVLAVPPIDRSRIVRRLSEGAVGGEADLLDLAEWTGGDLLFASAPDHAPSVAAQIAAELRHQYVIAIESADRPEWRRLEVKVRRKRMSVSARSGYFGR